jgi:hypothetical protein
VCDELEKSVVHPTSAWRNGDASISICHTLCDEFGKSGSSAILMKKRWCVHINSSHSVWRIGKTIRIDACTSSPVTYQFETQCVANWGSHAELMHPTNMQQVINLWHSVPQIGEAMQNWCMFLKCNMLSIWNAMRSNLKKPDRFDASFSNAWLYQF